MSDLLQFDLTEDEKKRVWANLAEWDSLENPLAPLTDEQLHSVHVLAKRCDPKYSLSGAKVNTALSFVILAFYASYS